MDRWKILVIGGVLVVGIGSLTAVGVVTTGYGLSTVNETASDAPNPRGPSGGGEVNLTTYEYDDLSDGDRETFDRMLAGNETVTEPLNVYEENGGDVAVTANNTTYAVNESPAVAHGGLYAAGLLSIFGGLLTIYYGAKQRGINELQEKIDEIERLAE